MNYCGSSDWELARTVKGTAKLKATINFDRSSICSIRAASHGKEAVPESVNRFE